MTLETSTLRRAGIALVAFSILVTLFLTPSHEPRYLGEPPSFWLRQVILPASHRHPETPGALEALHADMTPILTRRLLAQGGRLEGVRRRIVQILPFFGHPGNRIEEQRRHAAEAAEHLGPRGQRLVNDLAQGFRLASEPATRNAITSALHAFGPKVLPSLIPLCVDPDPRIQARSIDLLGSVVARHGLSDLHARDLATVLSLQLSALDSNVVLAATAVLALLGDDARVAVPALLGNLEHPAPGVRATSARTLARTADFDSDCIPALTRSLRDAFPEVQAAAASALGAFNELAAPAVPDLAEATGSRKAAVALAAIQALGRIGPGAEAAVPRLVTILNDRNHAPVIRLSIVTALGRIVRHPEVSVLPLVEALRDPDEYVRLGSARALAAFGPTAAPAVPALVEALSDPSESLRVGAAEALGRIGPPARSAIPFLHAARNNNQSVMNPPVLAAVARIEGHPPARPGIGEFSPSRSIPDKSPP